MNPNLSTSVLDRHPFFLLFQLGVRIQHLNQRLEDRAGISLTQWALLKRLADLPAIPALSLAEALGIQPSTLTQGLKRLESRKHLFVGKDPSDSRRKLISLTREGMQALQNADAEIETWMKESGVSSKQIQTMLSIMDSVIAD